MPSLQESLQHIFAVLDDFLNITLRNENLSKTADKERSKIVSLLKKVCADHDELNPSSKARVSTFKNNHRIEKSPSTESYPDFDSGGSPDGFAPTTVKALKNPTKIGFLQIKSSGQKQKPYCVLHKNVLYWFTKPSDRQQEGAICVKNYDFRADEKKIAKKNFIFELIGPGKKPYQFVADSKEDLESWKKGIMAAHEYKDQPGETKTTDHLDDGLPYEDVDGSKGNRLPIHRQDLPKPPGAANDEDNVYEKADYTVAVSDSDAHIYELDDEDHNVYENLDDCATETSKLKSSFPMFGKFKK